MPDFVAAQGLQFPNWVAVVVVLTPQNDNNCDLVGLVGDVRAGAQLLPLVQLGALGLGHLAECTEGVRAQDQQARRVGGIDDGEDRLGCLVSGSPGWLPCAVSCSLRRLPAVSA